MTQTQRGSAQSLAWVFNDKETLKPTLIAYKHAPLSSNQVRVKVLYFGVSNKDVQVIQSKEWNNLVPGYEVVGVVQAIGQKVGMRQVGDVVGVGFIKQSCRNCKICFNGKQQLCKNTQNPFSRNGGFGTHLTIPADWTFPIPKNLPLDVISPLFYSGVVAYNIINKQVERSQNKKLKVAIYGLGSIGYLAAKFANHFGLQVTVLSQNADDQSYLKQNGVKVEAFLPLTKEAISKNKYKFHLVLVANTLPAEVKKPAIEITQRNGRFVFLTPKIQQIGIKGVDLVVEQRQITGVKNGTKDNFYKMLQLVAHELHNKNNLLPTCANYNFTEITTVLQKVKSQKVNNSCVVKVDDNLVSKYNNNQI